MIFLIIILNCYLAKPLRVINEGYMMTHDVNGWQVLEKHLTSTPGNRQIFDDILGIDIDMELLSRGIHLLGIQQVKRLAAGLRMNKNSCSEFFNAIITARCASGCNHELEELKQAFCEHNRAHLQDIPCAEIDILWHFQPLHETLHSFMKRVAIASYRSSCNPGACAFRMTDCRMTAELDLPPGSLIIVDGTKPAHPGELALFQCRNRRLMLNKSTQCSQARIKWTSPVLELHIC